MVAGGASPSSSSPSSVFFSLLFFLSFSLFFSSYFLSSLFVFFSFGLPPLFYPLFCSLFPCFYMQKTREREVRVALVLPPLQHVESFGQVGALGWHLFYAF